MGMERTRLKILVKGEAVKERRMALKDFILIAENVQKAITNVAESLTEENLKEGDLIKVKRNVIESCQLDIINVFSGSFGIELGLRQLEINPTLFPDIGEEALQLFLNGVKLLNEKENVRPKGFNEKVLKNVRDLGRVFKKGINEIEFMGQIRTRRTETKLTQATTQKIEAMMQKSEIEEENELIGIVWEADWKDHTAELYTNLGNKVIVKFSEDFDEKIKQAARKRVKLSGKIKFENDLPKEIKLKEIELVSEEGAFKNSKIASLQEPSEQKAKQDPFLNANPISNFSFFDDFPSDWDVDDFVSTVYQMREEDTD